MKTRIICCGNPFRGNDGIGIRVLEFLAARFPELDIVDGGLGGLGLIPLMEGYDRIIIVDAIRGEGVLGAVQVFNLDSLNPVAPLTLHDLGITEAVHIARELGFSPEVLVVGIETGNPSELSSSMDPIITAAVPIASQIARTLFGK